MAIKITYNGPIRIPEIKNEHGGYDLDAIREKVFNYMPKSAANCSGVYIYFHRKGKGKLEARYIGANTTNSVLSEALSKTDFLSNKFLPQFGKPFLLLLICKKPKGITDDSFKRQLHKLEGYLIFDFSLKGHHLYNKNKLPRKPRFDFALNGKSRATTAFKKLANRRFSLHI
jgi:hypothetical protein